jgi:hypothetical protein
MGHDRTTLRKPVVTTKDAACLSRKYGFKSEYPLAEQLNKALNDHRVAETTPVATATKNKGDRIWIYQTRKGSGNKGKIEKSASLDFHAAELT